MKFPASSSNFIISSLTCLSIEYYYNSALSHSSMKLTKGGVTSTQSENYNLHTIVVKFSYSSIINYIFQPRKEQSKWLVIIYQKQKDCRFALKNISL